MSRMALGQSEPEPEGSALAQYALDGLNIGYLIGEELAADRVLAELGLPDDIVIRHSDTMWNVDLEVTPADWLYPGLILTIPYFRDGIAPNEGPYRDSRVVTEIRVTDGRVATKFGLGVGSSANDVIEALGFPDDYPVAIKDLKAIHYLLDYWRVQLSFMLDRPGGTVTEVRWRQMAGH